MCDLCSLLIISARGSQLKATFGTRKPPTILLVGKLHYGLMYAPGFASTEQCLELKKRTISLVLLHSHLSKLSAISVKRLREYNSKSWSTFFAQKE